MSLRYSKAQKRIANAVHHTVKSNRALLSIPNGWLVIALGGGITFFVYRRKKCQIVFCLMIVYNFVPVIKTHFVSAQVLVFITHSITKFIALLCGLRVECAFVCMLDLHQRT